MLRPSEDKMRRPQEDKLLRCDICRTPIAAVEEDALVIRSTHHGERHVTRIPLSRLGIDKSESTE